MAVFYTRWFLIAIIESRAYRKTTMFAAGKLTCLWRSGTLIESDWNKLQSHFRPWIGEY